MQMNCESISLKRVPVGDDFPDMDGLRRIMEAQFPPEEVFPVDGLRRVCAEKGFVFDAYYDGETLVGFLCLLETDEFSHGFYLAVAPGLTGRGYGTKILGSYLAAIPDKIFYGYVEPPDENAENAEQRRRRIALYERLGMRLEDHVAVLAGQPFQRISTAHRFPEEKRRRGAAFVREVAAALPNAIAGASCEVKI